MIHRESWYVEASPSEIPQLLKLKSLGEDVDEELRSLARRQNYPPSIPQEVYRQWWEEAFQGDPRDPEVQRELPYLFAVVFPDFLQRLWKSVGEWDPRDLRRLFEGDRELEDAKDIAWQEPEDFEVQQGYRPGFFEATDFVVSSLSPAFEKVWEQYQKRSYVSPGAIEELRKTLEDYTSHREVIEHQVEAAQHRSVMLNYYVRAGELEREYGPSLALLEGVEDFPEGSEFRSWLNGMFTTVDAIVRYRTASPAQIKSLKELEQEWSTKWLPLVERVEEETGTYRSDIYEESW